MLNPRPMQVDIADEDNDVTNTNPKPNVDNEVYLHKHFHLFYFCCNYCVFLAKWSSEIDSKTVNTIEKINYHNPNVGRSNF